jgi:hypothetical protein
MDQIDSKFHGYAGEPQSELEIAFLLGLVYDYLPFRYVVQSINDAFPDCMGIDPLTGKPIRIELEVYSRNYISHGHPLAGCDYIICWRDNWPDSPIPIISIEDIIDINGLEGNRLIFIPKEGSLRIQLDELKEKDIVVFESVTHFLNKVVPVILERHKGALIDDRFSRHFIVRDFNGRGVLGFYPHGKLVCISVKEAVKRYGKEVEGPAKSFRDEVMGVKILRSKDQGEQVGKALDVFLNVLSIRE